MGYEDDEEMTLYKLLDILEKVRKSNNECGMLLEKMMSENDSSVVADIIYKYITFMSTCDDFAECLNDFCKWLHRIEKNK